MPQWRRCSDISNVEPSISVQRNSVLVVIVAQNSNQHLGELNLEVGGQVRVDGEDLDHISIVLVESTSQVQRFGAYSRSGILLHDRENDSRSHYSGFPTS